MIKILSLKEDLCEQLKNVDEECPVEEGKLRLTRDVDLPQRIPPVSWFHKRIPDHVLIPLCRAYILSKQMCIPRTTRRLLA